MLRRSSPVLHSMALAAAIAAVVLTACGTNELALTVGSAAPTMAAPVTGDGPPRGQAQTTDVEQAVRQEVVRIVEIDPEPNFRVDDAGTAGPAALQLDDGRQLQLGPDTPITAFCALLLPPGTVTDRPCFGVAHLRGTEVIHLHMFLPDLVEGQPRTVAATTNVRVRSGTVTLHDGTTLAADVGLEVSCPGWTPADLESGISTSAFVTVDESGRAILLECLRNFD